jgi:hypothetical protein
LRACFMLERENKGPWTNFPEGMLRVRACFMLERENNGPWTNFPEGTLRVRACFMLEREGVNEEPGNTILE